VANQLQWEAEGREQAAECLVEAVVASAAECQAEAEPECQVECQGALEAGHKAEEETGAMVLVYLVETTLWMIHILVLEATGVVTSMETVEEIKECTLQVDALVPELQCLEPVGDMVAVKNVVCNNANEIAIDEVEVSVPRKKVVGIGSGKVCLVKAVGFAIQMLDLEWVVVVLAVE